MTWNVYYSDPGFGVVSDDTAVTPKKWVIRRFSWKRVRRGFFLSDKEIFLGRDGGGVDLESRG